MGPDGFLFCLLRVDQNPIRVVGPIYQDVVSHLDNVEKIHGDQLALRFHCQEPRENCVAMTTTLDAFDSQELGVTLPGRAFDAKTTVATFVFCVEHQERFSPPPSIQVNYDPDRPSVELELINLTGIISVQCLVTIFDIDAALLTRVKVQHTFTNLSKYEFSRNDISLDSMLAWGEGGEAVFRFKMIYGTDCRNTCQPSEIQDLRCRGVCSDFQLKCGTETFPVHRSILCARSPVFKAMLSSGMQEAASGCMDVQDMDPPSLKIFLEYLYTGSFKGAPSDSALQLYRAADKYQVPSLRMECSLYFRGNMSVSNVCDVLFLGDRHGDEELVSVAQNFILENFKQVSVSKEWQDYMKTNPDLLLKTVTLFAAKGCFDNCQIFDNVYSHHYMKTDPYLPLNSLTITSLPTCAFRTLQNWLLPCLVSMTRRNSTGTPTHSRVPLQRWMDDLGFYGA